jgi:hypothetical protein
MFRRAEFCPRSHQAAVTALRRKEREEPEISSKLQRCSSGLSALLTLLGNERGNAEWATSLLHQFLEAASGLVPEARLKRHIAGAPSPTLVFARTVTASALATTIVVHLAGVIASGRADSGSGAVIAMIGSLAATGVQTAAYMGIGKQGILVSSWIVSRHSVRTGSKTCQRGQCQPREITTTQVVLDSHFRLRQSSCSCPRCPEHSQQSSSRD